MTCKNCKREITPNRATNGYCSVGCEHSYNHELPVVTLKIPPELLEPADMFTFSRNQLEIAVLKGIQGWRDEHAKQHLDQLFAVIRTAGWCYALDGGEY